MPPTPTCARVRSGPAPLRARTTAGLLGRWGVCAWLVALAACSDSARPPADAGVGDAATLSCTAGTAQCVCSSAGGCEDNLLCISGRCLSSEGPRSPLTDDRPRGPVQALPPALEDAAAPGASGTDAAASDNPDAASGSPPAPAGDPPTEDPPASVPPSAPPDASVDASG
jgi:hypothetical protein